MKKNHKLALALLAGVSIGISGAMAVHAQQIRTPPAYVVAELDVTDPATYQQYSAKVPETLAPFNGHFIVRGGKTQAVEGGGTGDAYIGVAGPARVDNQGEPSGVDHLYRSRHHTLTKRTLSPITKRL